MQQENIKKYVFLVIFLYKICPASVCRKKSPRLTKNHKKHLT